MGADYFLPYKCFQLKSKVLVSYFVWISLPKICLMSDCVRFSHNKYMPHQNMID